MPEDVRFTASDGVELVGSLTVPRQDAVGSPGLVLVGGSGRSDRPNGGFFDDLGSRLVAAGVAVLAYDKRGAGASSGGWATAGVDVLAADAAAALTLLRDHPAVVGENVGLLGHSEGGWVALRVAGRLATPRHLILNSCPAVSFQRAELYAQIRAGVDESTAARSFERLAQLAASGGSRAQAQRVLTDAADEATRAALAAENFELTQQTWAQFTAWAAYDPTSDLRDLAVPTLAIFGEDDDLTPARESESILRDLAATVIRTAVFPNADHRLRVGPVYAPGYFDTLIDWCEMNAR